MTNTTGATTDGMPPAGPPPERVVARLRSHGRALFWPSLVLIAACGILGYVGGRLPEGWQNLAVLTGAILVVVLLWLLPLIFWLNRRYTITTRRIILRHGFFIRTRQELLHSRGYDVSVRRTWLQSAFRSGDVRINAGLEQPIVLRDVPNADLVLRAINDLMEANHNLVATHLQQERSAPSDETRIWGER
ncbi:PH domain-containing protein [Compostimonas suwonensis]|uniref:Membrane protein YdbS with pleckstrin-like domain n=1 Tax=Compostimonas suwonensis TaxID=1048394 RepID=A0A2M9BUY6_9MICO|nr:PH domain-containing protein [Compostimonas suwonensis]PJJ61763.1 membrane protein YdbS with pleckstrin-like domain [Compostimonas suwonensis]